MNKCSIEQTKQKIDLYYTVRSKIPELFENANPKLPHMRKMMDVIYLIALPKLTKNMNRVTMFKVRKYVPSNEYDFLSYYSHIINLVELRLKEDYFLGNIIILDMQNVPLEMVGKNPLNLSLKLTTIYKNVAKSPLEAIYIINYPPFVGHLLFIFQICLSRKIFERIRIIESVETLQELVGKEILPVEYGGEEKSLEELN
ncbi:CRAL TRIO domain containing protein, partial [Asbolus verrucosus]